VTLSSGSFHDCTSPEEKIAKKRPQQTYIPAANQNTFLHKTGSFYKDFVKKLLENDRFVPYRCRKTAHSTVPKSNRSSKNRLIFLAECRHGSVPDLSDSLHFPNCRIRRRQQRPPEVPKSDLSANCRRNPDQGEPRLVGEYPPG
jgi:hypothetical protein